jgi:Ca-activated chloride channel family protein
MSMESFDRGGVLKPSGQGLVGWLEQTRVELPLKGVECRFRVCGDLLSVEIDQIFHVNTPKAIDCVYSFPLPAGAAVYRCELHVNGRVIRARVEESARAIQLAREHRAAGRRTALVTMERDNLFTLALGNLQPGDIAVVRLAYFETLARLKDQTALRIPFSPGVRYIPGRPLLRQLRGKGVADDTDEVPDASRISPPRIDELHPEAAYLSVQGVVENPWSVVTDLSSASHPLIVEDGAQEFRVRLADRDAVPSGDFSLRWSESMVPALQSVALAVREGGETHALVLLAAPEIAASEKPVPEDFYFLLDRSGSMEGEKWLKAVQAFRAFLQHVGPQDRVWLGLFSDGCTDFAERPMTRAELERDTGLATMEQLRPGGGTEMGPAIDYALAAMRRHSTGRSTQLILITDGQVGNESEILRTLGKFPAIRCHAFGIDLAVNDGFLQKLAAQQQGSCCLMLPTDDIAGAVGRLGARLRRPVVTSLTAGEGWEFPDGVLPSLYSEDRLSLSVRTSGGEARHIAISGTTADGTPTQFKFELIDRDEPAIRLLWASRRMNWLLRQGDRAGAIALGRQHNLICEGAAFIAWDDKEKVPVASSEVYQPSLETLKEARLRFFQSEPGFRAHRRLPVDRQTLYNKIKSYQVSKDSRIEGESRYLAPLDEFEVWAERFRFGIAIRHLNGGHEIIDFIRLWRNDSGRGIAKRDEALEMLVNTLETIPADDRPAKLDAFRKWIVGDFKRAGGDARAMLKLLEARVQLVEEMEREVARRLQKPFDTPAP